MRYITFIFIGILCFNDYYLANAQGDAKKILETSIKTYAQSATYQDFGTVTSTIETKDGKSKSQLIFRTAYNRKTGQFRFAYLEEKRTRFMILDEKCFVIWSNGKEVKSWWTLGEHLSEHQRLTEPLANATGVSGTASRKIPGLLLAEPINAGWDIRQLQSPELFAIENVKDIPCYHLRATLKWMQQDDTIDIWIDRTTYLIKKLIHNPNESIIGMKVTKILEYDPQVNVPILSKYLEFNYQDCLIEK